jgi:predicted DCC family thiol-disulfide oxidoreductase YuxK
MKKLYVLYDASCGFCWKCRGWLQQQPQFVDLEFIASRSPEVAQRFPGIHPPMSPSSDSAANCTHVPLITCERGTCHDPNSKEGKDELVVISDDGGVYRGAQAFIMCLYALEGYRDWAEWLSSPALLPLARPAFEMLSKNRKLLGDWLHLGGEEYLAAKLKHLQK